MDVFEVLFDCFRGCVLRVSIDVSGVVVVVVDSLFFHSVWFKLCG